MKKITLKEVIDAERIIYAYGEQEGFMNINDKAKLKEVKVANILGHKLFEGASGGKDSEKYGADALQKDGTKAEYKSITLSKSKYKKFKNGQSYSLSGVYNGAYTFENIEKYRGIDHYFSVHYNEKTLAIVKVDTDHIIDTLTDTLSKRIRRAKQTGKELTTNGNSVSVQISINESNKGKVVYVNKAM